MAGIGDSDFSNASIPFPERCAVGGLCQDISGFRDILEELRVELMELSQSAEEMKAHLQALLGCRLSMGIPQQ